MRRSFAVALVTFLAGCSELVWHPGRAQLAVSQTGCDGAERAAGATEWRFRILGNGALAEERTGKVSDGFPKEVALPEGLDVAVRLEAFDGPPSAGRLVAWGQSRTVTAREPRQELFLTVALAPPEQFVDLCVRLGRPRASHTATLLPDARVLLVGGSTGGPNPATHDSMELLDPSTRTTEDAGSLRLAVNGGSVLFALEDHAAAAWGPQGVLLWGGRAVSPAGKVSTSLMLVWDQEVRRLAAFPVGTQGPVRRYGHTLLRQGTELFALGGLTGGPADPAPASAIELLSDSGLRSVVGSLAPALTGRAVSGADFGAVVAGGAEPGTGAVSGDVQILRLARTLEVRWSGNLATARTRATAFALGDGVLIAGGEDNSQRPLGETEWLLDGPPRLAPGPVITPRASPCAARLLDGRVLLLGGVASGQPSNAAELLSPDGTARQASFPGAGRYAHTCTTLADGSVLVTGGLGTGDVALSDAWRYVPPPPP